MPTAQYRLLVLGLNFAPEPTGIAPYTSGMTRGLARRGHHLRVLTAHPHYPQWQITPGYGQWSRREHLSGVPVTRLRHYVPNNPVTVRRALSELSFGMRQVCSRWGHPDAIIAVSPALFATTLCVIRARVFHRSTPVVIWVQDLYALGIRETAQSGRMLARLMTFVEGFVLRRSDRVVVIHDRFASIVAGEFGIPRERIDVVRNWSHVATTDADRGVTREGFGWQPDETVVLHSGNMGVKQGLVNVVNAGRIASQRGDRVRFVLVGNGAQRELLVELAADVQNVDILHPLDDDQFVAALAAADILLVNELPGVSEMAVPSKLTSYFAAARPVIAATDVGGITAEEVRSAEAGIVVPAGNPEALLDAAIALGSDAFEMNRLGANGRAYREQLLSETSAIEKFDMVLASVIDGDDVH